MSEKLFSEKEIKEAIEEFILEEPDVFYARITPVEALRKFSKLNLSSEQGNKHRHSWANDLTIYCYDCKEMRAGDEQYKVFTPESMGGEVKETPPETPPEKVGEWREQIDNWDFWHEMLGKDTAKLKEKLKSFIGQLLEEERQCMIAELIAGKMPKPGGAYSHGYNDALDEAVESLLEEHND